MVVFVLLAVKLDRMAICRIDVLHAAATLQSSVRQGPWGSLPVFYVLLQAFEWQHNPQSHAPTIHNTVW